MGKDVIIACDFDSAEKVFAFLDKFTGRKPFVKIGMELYYAEGPSIVREIKKRGHKIFLDLKLHDIPNTVKKSMAVLSRLDVDMTNLHAAGTVSMMEAAIEGLTREDGTRPMLIAVTQLTSTDQERMEKDLLIKAPIADVVMHYAHNAKIAGLDGVVCSPLEAGKVHETCGDGFVTVTGKEDVKSYNKKYCLTEKSEKITSYIDEDIGAYMAKARADIPEEDMKTFYEVLASLTKNISLIACEE